MRVDRPRAGGRVTAGAGATADNRVKAAVKPLNQPVKPLNHPVKKRNQQVKTVNQDLKNAVSSLGTKPKAGM
ncbi:MAG: hypothetical protein JOZ49_08350 [Mycolicibacterium sp.]|nr:hypothetical protein [Mycolicibacterium sp.]